MFGKGRIFKVPKHQQFNYKPMHYDPQKEELADRLESLKELQKDDVEGRKARIASALRGGYQQDESYRRQQVRRSNIKLVVVVVALLLVGYLLLNVYLPELNKFLE